MDFDDPLGPKPNVVDLQAKDRWSAIEELIGHLATTGKIRLEHVNEITAAVKRRENSMSTAIGFDVALPHAVTDLISEPVGVVGRAPKGIPFEALDGKPVSLVLLFLVPQGQLQRHMNFLANMAKMLHDPDARGGWRRRFE